MQAPSPGNYQLQKIVEGLNAPLYLTHTADGTDRLFVLEQRGVIRIIDKEGNLLKTPFLDISEQVRSGGERGLLGLAFHPAYKENGYFYVHYSDNNGDTVISRFKVSNDPDVADPGSKKIVLTQDQPFGNHNGGQIEFGPDGYLYIGLGDGGAAGDPLVNGQNPATLLGAILRINVNDEEAYNNPLSNPFIGSFKERAEVWAYGLRNPWRFSFDRATGDLYIADVGQNNFEEVNFQSASSVGGENYGWNQMEGMHCFTAGCIPDQFILPVAEYTHADGCSITGGYVYRGSFNPDLHGIYLYGDYCSGNIWTLFKTEQGEWKSSIWMRTSLSISSFGEDEAGEIYIIDHGGGIYLLRTK